MAKEITITEILNARKKNQREFEIAFYERKELILWLVH